MLNKIDTEYQKFKEFKKNFVYHLPPIEKINDIDCCMGCPLYDVENKLIGESDKWVNIGIMIKHPISRVLSNLYPYEFEFRGYMLKSIESFFQGIKFKDKNMQELVFTYSGYNAYCLKAASDSQNGRLYWQGKALDRNSAEYADIVDELYICAAQNPLFRQALKNVFKPLIHTIGKTDPNETVLTRFEYEAEINALAAFVKK